MKQYAIAIDGPSGAGKSTLARRLSEELGFLYVDTGAIYRTVGLATRRAGVDPKDREGVIALLPGLVIGLEHGEDGLQHMLLGGEDVSSAIREPEISMYASAVSAIPEVRAFLMEQQRGLARIHNVIMDGRDIGTVVLPNADLKIFLTATPEARAERRWKELKKKGMEEPFEKVLAEIQERDYNDSHRAAAPLKQAEDAVYFDSTEYTLDEVTARLLDIIKENWN